MSSYQYVYPSETVCRMEFLLKSASDMIVFRKIQCLYLRAKLGFEAQIPADKPAWTKPFII